MTGPDDSSPPPAASANAAGLFLLFAALYFIQGIAEPSEGLIAQPVRSMLKGWGRSAGQISALMATLIIPWTIKPLYGLISDFVPLGRSRRRNWLILATLISSVGLGSLYLFPPAAGADAAWLSVLLIPTIAVAFTDVVTDSLMVEKGQPLGLTGRFQSVQWASIYAATALTGTVGGWLSQTHQQPLGFLICAIAATCGLVLAIVCVREPIRRVDEPGLAVRINALRQAAVSRRFIGAALFLLLWNFNPFSTTIQYLYLTRHLHLSEQFYGNTVTVFSVACMAASLAYGVYCRRLSTNGLIHLSILMGMLSTLLYLGLEGPRTAMALAGLTGLTYMTGSLVQLDLAARACPSQVAGTVFAALMSLCNLGIAAGTEVGGWVDDRLSPRIGPHNTFDLLVLIGAGSTAACWLLYPLLRHQGPHSPAAVATPPVPASGETGGSLPAPPPAPTGDVDCIGFVDDGPHLR